MGTFNEQSFDHPFAKGIQGAPGVGFSLTADGNYDMNKKRLTNVGAPSANTDAATKKYVDDDSDEPATKQYSDSRFLDRNGSRTMIGNLSMNNNKIIKVGTPTANDDVATKKYVDDKSSGSLTSTRLTVDSNIDMKNTYRITNLSTPLDGKEPPTKDYVDNTFLDRDGSYPMKGNLNMDNNRIFNLPAPTGPKQPTPLAFTDLKYLHVAGTNKMTNNLNMDNKSIIHLKPPTSDTDAATKKYVDDNTGVPDLSDYLEKDGSVTMTGNLNVGINKIINLNKPTQNNDATNKDYVDKLAHHTAVQPSHYNDQFSYLMSSSAQWTDEIGSGTSFFISKIGDLSPSNGNFHNYNHKAIFVTINKNSQGGYKYKMGVNFYRLTANNYFTLCLEILNTDYHLWHKSQISVDRGTSTGLNIENVSVKKLSHRYINNVGSVQFMYYHRIIVNFKKLTSGNKFFLHFLVNIPQEGIDLAVYPNQFKGVYFITYGVIGKVSNIDPDKVYDYHTAFDIHPTEVVYNVDVNMNSKKILNINTDASSNSAATVGMVNKLKPSIKFYIYRKFFEEFYDFSDAKCYNLVTSASGVVFNSISSISGDSARNITFPNKTIDNINHGSLTVNGYTLLFTPASKQTSYTLCLVFTIWPNRNWSLYKYDVTNPNRKNLLLSLYYLNTNKNLYLHISNTRKSLTIPNSFFGKTIVLWLTENISTPITKVNFSNYSAELIINSASYSANQRFEYLNSATEIYRYMYSPNFYDTHGVQHHTILLEEKLLGNYVD